MPSKISDLAQPNLPLVGTELLELSQDSTSVQVTVDELESSVDHNNLAGLQGGDSTTEEYYHVTQAEKDGIFSGSPVIGLGDSAGTNLTVDYGTNVVTSDVDSVEMLKLETYFQTLGDKVGGPYIEVEKSDGETAAAINLVRSSGRSIEMDVFLSFKYATSTFVNSTPSAGTTVNIGSDKAGLGSLNLYGRPSGFNEGGNITLYSAFDYEGVIDNVEIKMTHSFFWISPDDVSANSIQFVGASEDWNINAQGNVILTASGGVQITTIKSGATQVGAGAAAKELWKTASHATLPDNVVMIGV